jgi:hypothetical protein
MFQSSKKSHIAWESKLTIVYTHSSTQHSAFYRAKPWGLYTRPKAENTSKMLRCGLEVGTMACQVGVEPIPRSRADRPFSLDWWAIVPIHQKVLHCLEIEGMGKLEAIPTVLYPTRRLLQRTNLWQLYTRPKTNNTQKCGAVDLRSEQEPNEISKLHQKF